MSYTVHVKIEHGNKHADPDEISKCGKYVDPDYDSPSGCARIVANALRQYADEIELETVDDGFMRVVPQRTGDRFNVYLPNGKHHFGMTAERVDYLEIQGGYKRLAATNPESGEGSSLHPDETESRQTDLSQKPNPNRENG